MVLPIGLFLFVSFLYLLYMVYLATCAFRIVVQYICTVWYSLHCFFRLTMREWAAVLCFQLIGSSAAPDCACACQAFGLWACRCCTSKASNIHDLDSSTQMKGTAILRTHIPTCCMHPSPFSLEPECNRFYHTPQFVFSCWGLSAQLNCTTMFPPTWRVTEWLTTRTFNADTQAIHFSLTLPEDVSVCVSRVYIIQKNEYASHIIGLL